MNLVIDIGNTKTKLAVFQGNKIIFKSSGDLQLLLKDCISLKAKFKTIDKTIISSVGNLNEQILVAIEKLFKV